MRSTALLIMLLVACGESAVAPESLTPPKPEGVLTTARTGEIVLSWRDVANETSYRVEVKGDDGSWTPLAQAPANTTSYTHTGVLHSVMYVYRVAACNEQGCSDWVEAAGTWQSATAPVLNIVTVNTLRPTQANFVASGFDGGLTTKVVFTLTKAGNPTVIFRSDVLEAFGIGTPSEFGRAVTATYTYHSLEPNTDYLLSATFTNTIGMAPALPPFAFRTPAS